MRFVNLYLLVLLLPSVGLLNVIYEMSHQTPPSVSHEVHARKTLCCSLKLTKDIKNMLLENAKVNHYLFKH